MNTIAILPTSLHSITHSTKVKRFIEMFAPPGLRNSTSEVLSRGGESAGRTSTSAVSGCILWSSETKIPAPCRLPSTVFGFTTANTFLAVKHGGGRLVSVDLKHKKGNFIYLQLNLQHKV